MKFYKKKTNVKVKICPECMGTNVKIFHEEQDLTIDTGWTPVKFFIPLIKCNECNNISEALEAVEAIHDASCVAMGLLPPDEIKRIRKDLGFGNAVDFARLLEVGDSTVKRWESRSAFPNKVSIRAIQTLMDQGVEYYKGLKDSKALSLGLIESLDSAEIIDLSEAKARVFSSLNKSNSKIFSSKEKLADANRMVAGFLNRRTG